MALLNCNSRITSAKSSNILSNFHQNMKNPRSPKGFTLVELLVVISIIAVLASLAVPAVTSAIVKGQIIQAVNNARQIHIATMSMANDGAANSDSSLGWPGDTGVTTVSDFVGYLVGYDYLKVGDLKVFAAAGIQACTGATIDITTGTAPKLGGFDASKNSAFYVYKVSDNDGGSTVFLTTKNYSFSTTPTLDAATKPFGDKGFVVCRKGGDVGQYKAIQKSATAIIGNVTTSANTGYLEMK